MFSEPKNRRNYNSQQILEIPEPSREQHETYANERTRRFEDYQQKRGGLGFRAKDPEIRWLG